MQTVHYRAADIGGLKISYREAGRADAPTLLLLHGFPTAGHMFRDLISLLADSFHLVAPDLPGFGQSDMPPRSAFKYTFENLAETIDRFTEVIGLKRFAIYIFDYNSCASDENCRWTCLTGRNPKGWRLGGFSEAKPSIWFWTSRWSRRRRPMRNRRSSHGK